MPALTIRKPLLVALALVTGCGLFTDPCPRQGWVTTHRGADSTTGVRVEFQRYTCDTLRVPPITPPPR
jgi:hypothetical protein